MEIFKKITEDPQHAYDQLLEDLLISGDVALGSKATVKDRDRYNWLHAQTLEHRDGSKGHLILHQEEVIFDANLVGRHIRISLPLAPKKIPYWLEPGTNNVIIKKK